MKSAAFSLGKTTMPPSENEEAEQIYCKSRSRSAHITLTHRSSTRASLAASSVENLLQTRNLTTCFSSADIDSDIRTLKRQRTFNFRKFFSKTTSDSTKLYSDNNNPDDSQSTDGKSIAWSASEAQSRDVHASPSTPAIADSSNEGAMYRTRLHTVGSLGKSLRRTAQRKSTEAFARLQTNRRSLPTDRTTCVQLQHRKEDFFCNVDSNDAAATEATHVTMPTHERQGGKTARRSLWKSFRIRRKIFSPKAKTTLEKSPIKKISNNAGCSLMEVLNSKEMRTSFHNFLQQEYSEENLEFWIEVDKYKKKKNFEKSASTIFHKYIELQATKEVNIDCQIRKQIRSELPAPGPTMFDEAQRHVYRLMKENSYARFVASLSSSRSK